MNRITQIQKTLFLEDSQKKLEKSLDKINIEINENQQKCTHIGICIGDNETGHCLLCNKELAKQELENLKNEELIVYSDKRPIKEDSYSLNQFESIQIMFLGMCKMNVNKSNKELVQAINEMINYSEENTKSR